MVTRYGLYATLVALAVLGVMYFLAVGEVASLKLQMESDKRAAAELLNDKLSAQSVAHAEAIKTERFAASAREKFDRQTLSLAQKEADHANTVARSLIVIINRLLDHANTEFGPVPAGPGRPAGSPGAATKDAVGTSDQYTDAQAALEDYARWAETGWGRVRAIAAVQGAGCQAH